MNFLTKIEKTQITYLRDKDVRQVVYYNCTEIDWLQLDTTDCF